MMSRASDFASWAKAEGVLHEASLETVTKGNVEFKIAIDAEDFLSSILTGGQSTYEPLLPALGGVPFTLESHIDTRLEAFQTSGIKPTFVFSGGLPVYRERNAITRDSIKASAVLNEAWNIYARGRAEESVDEFGKVCTYRTDHILRHLFFYLHKKRVEVLVAPYESSAQVAYMLEIKAVKAVLGAASCLVFGAPKVIIDIDVANDKLSWVEREVIQQRMGVTKDSLEDICLLSGCSLLPPHPEVESSVGPSRMNAAKDLLFRSGRNAQAACMQGGGDSYLNIYRKAKAASHNMVVIQNGGEVKQMNFETSPSDAHDFVGQRLPDEIYNYTSRGLLSFRVLNSRTRLEVLETPPLDGGDNISYKELVQKKLLPLRARALQLLTRSLHRWYHRKDVDLVCWFNPDQKQALGITDLNDVAKDADTWNVKASVLAQAPRSTIDVNVAPLQYAISTLSDDTFAKKTKTVRKDSEHSILVKPAEVLANTTWRFLQDRGYINNDHTLSAWGKALKSALDKASEDGLLGSTPRKTEVEELIFVAFELLRLDMLNGRTVTPNPPYMERISRGSDTDRAHMNLICKIAALGNFQHHELGYTGPLSRVCLAFQQTAATVRSSLRDLVEVHACNLMTSGSAVRSRDYKEYTDLGAQLPFQHEPDAGLAIMVKSYLDEVINTGEKQDVRNWILIASDMEGDLAKVWRAWDAINAGVQAADSGIVSSDTKSMFRNTDQWLADKRDFEEFVKQVSHA